MTPTAAIVRSPLSPQQRRLLEGVRRDGAGRSGADGANPYRAALAVRVESAAAGEPAEAAVRAAVEAVVAAHEVLRSSFPDDGEGARVHPSPRLCWSAVDLAALDGEARRRACDDAFEALWDAAAPDLTTAPLLTARWLRLGGGTGELHLAMPALLADGAALDRVTEELAAALTALAAAPSASPLPGLVLPGPPMQHGELAAWLHRLYEEGEATRADEPPPLELPDLAAGGGGGGPFRPRFAPVAGPTEGWPTGGLAAVGAAPEAVLLAVWLLLLARSGGGRRGAVALPFAARPYPEMAASLGPFATALPVTAELAPGESFRALARRLEGELQTAGERWLEWFPWQPAPCDAAFDAAPPAPQHRAGDLVLSRRRRRAVLEPFAVALQAEADSDGAWTARVAWDASRLPRREGHRLAARYGQLLADALARPDAALRDLDPLPAAERRLLLGPWAGGAAASEEAAGEEAASATLWDLFAAQAARRPAAPALTCEGETLSYGELARRAEALARRLARRGVGAGSVVGLYLDRSPELVVALLAVLRAGGAYLPLDPVYPPQRLAFMLADSRAALVLSHGELAAALPAGGPPLLRLDGALDDASAVQGAVEREAGGGDPISAAPPPPIADALAYVIYTSGSTGAPKGALISHANVVRLLRRTEPWFAFGEDDVWTLFHSAAFDFSVWEIWGALAYGGRLVVVPYWVSRSPRDFHELLRREAVTVLNQTPSAFAQLVRADAAAPAAPLALRCVVFGGEALEMGTLAPWFAARGDERPRLVNMYGITETTVHVTYRPLTAADAAADAAPARQRSVGRAIPDLSTWVVDAAGGLRLPGVPGELLVGGAGLARGYLGRPALTAQRFVPDPFSGRPGRRLYRTGDLVRHLADGELEYLGRIDHQVKIRGFRIELGEIEAALAAHPAVAAAAVLVREDAPGQKRLVAYLTGLGGAAQPPAADDLRTDLAPRLPDYMVPSAFVVLDALPLTENGKVDRRALGERPAPEVEAGAAYAPPRDAAEETLAAIWATVLGVERVGVEDNFFQLGGDSILSIQVVSRARRAGFDLSPRQIFEHQTVAELAAVAGRGAAPSSSAPASGEMPLTPIQRWFLDADPVQPQHYNQALLLRPAAGLVTAAPASAPATDPARLRVALAAVFAHHDAFRLRFPVDPSAPAGRRAVYAPPAEQDGSPPLAVVDLAALPDTRRRGALEEACAALQASLDLERGPLARAAFFARGAAPPRLLLLAHHLVVDGVSWRLLLEDLATAVEESDPARAAAVLPPRSDSFAAWGRYLESLAAGYGEAEAAFWLDQGRRATGAAALPAAPEGDAGDALRDDGSPAGETASHSLELDAETSGELLRGVPEHLGAEVQDALLAAVAAALARAAGAPAAWLDVEGHGRQEVEAVDAAEAPDVSRTVGWFTSLYPLLVEVPAQTSPRELLAAVRESRLAVPGKGLGYGVLRWLAAETAAALAAVPAPQVAFNYLGRAGGAGGGLWRLAEESPGPHRSPRQRPSHALTVTASVREESGGARLRVDLAFSRRRLDAAWVESLAGDVEATLRQLAAAARQARPAPAPADFPLAADLGADELAALVAARPGVVDVYPLSPLQKGILFHALYAPQAEEYFEQLSVRVDGPLEPAVFRAAWGRVVERHPVLRTSFYWDRAGEPLQVVHEAAEVPSEVVDWSAVEAAEQERRLGELEAADRRRGFELARAPLMRFTLVRLGGAGDDARHRLIWSRHHLLLDGWSRSRLLEEFFAEYRGLRLGEPPELTAPRPYRDYVAWLEAEDPVPAQEHWRRTLAGFRRPTPLGIGRAEPPAGGASAGSAELPPGDLQRRLPAALSADVAAFARRHRLTVNSVLQGAWALLLAGYSGERDLVFGSVVSGRPPQLEGVEQMIGLFINNLPVRVQVAAQRPLLPWLEELQRAQVEQRRFEATPLARVQAVSEVPRGLPLFDSMLVFENFPHAEHPEAAAGELRFSDPRFTLRVNVPLAITAAAGERFLMQVSFDAARFEETAVERLFDDFETVLGAMAAAPRASLGELGETVAAAQRRRRQVAEKDLDALRLGKLKQIRRRKARA